MNVLFLGTSAGTPTRRRNVTAQAVRFDHGAVWLLDCGEGTQQQALRFGLSGNKIERILITHLHGDHCLGLPGMLAWMGIHGRQHAVEVIGPRGIDELLNTVLRLTDATLPFPLTITALDGPMDLPAHHGWSVQARPLVHRVPCYGYVLSEAERPGRFHEDRAQRLGVPSGRQRQALLRGDIIHLADGTRITPAQVCDPPRRGRRIVLLGDTSDPSAIATAAHGCDLLVCEATYADDRAAKAHEWGHMTAGATGAFAHSVGAHRLAITHYSARYTDPGRPGHGIDLLKSQAQAQAPAVDVLTVQDGDVIEVA